MTNQLGKALKRCREWGEELGCGRADGRLQRIAKIGRKRLDYCREQTERLYCGCGESALQFPVQGLPKRAKESKTASRSSQTQFRLESVQQKLRIGVLQVFESGLLKSRRTTSIGTLYHCHKVG